MGGGALKCPTKERNRLSTKQETSICGHHSRVSIFPLQSPPAGGRASNCLHAAGSWREFKFGAWLVLYGGRSNFSCETIFVSYCDHRIVSEWARRPWAARAFIPCLERHSMSFVHNSHTTLDWFPWAVSTLAGVRVSWGAFKKHLSRPHPQRVGFSTSEWPTRRPFLSFPSSLVPRQGWELSDHTLHIDIWIIISERSISSTPKLVNLENLYYTVRGAAWLLNTSHKRETPALPFLIYQSISIW